MDKDKGGGIKAGCQCRARACLLVPKTAARLIRLGHTIFPRPGLRRSGAVPRKEHSHQISGRSAAAFSRNLDFADLRPTTIAFALYWACQSRGKEGRSRSRQARKRSTPSPPKGPWGQRRTGNRLRVIQWQVWRGRRLQSKPEEGERHLALAKSPNERCLKATPHQLERRMPPLSV